MSSAEQLVPLKQQATEAIRLAHAVVKGIEGLLGSALGEAATLEQTLVDRRAALESVNAELAMKRARLDQDKAAALEAARAAGDAELAGYGAAIEKSKKAAKVAQDEEAKAQKDLAALTASIAEAQKRLNALTTEVTRRQADADTLKREARAKLEALA